MDEVVAEEPDRVAAVVVVAVWLSLAGGALGVFLVARAIG